MNEAQNVWMMTIKMPTDAYAKLAEWAADNVSSMNAELVRSVRDRVERDKYVAAEQHAFYLCVPKIRFGVDAASGRRKLAS